MQHAFLTAALCALSRRSASVQQGCLCLDPPWNLLARDDCSAEFMNALCARPARCKSEEVKLLQPYSSHT